ncbi:MAG: hypothetical protein E6767_10835 [Dysgonomonas sp.]|nr:hypothetical protein [Dysgonomonas sp.]
MKIIQYCKDFISYFFRSKNRDNYISLSRVFAVSSFKVYRLAHGRIAKDEKEIAILYELRNLGIISEIKISYY